MADVDGILVFEWVWLAVTFAFVALRIYIRFPSEIRTLSLSSIADLLVVIAWLSFLVQGSLDIVVSKTVFFDDPWADDIPWPARSWAMKLYFIESVIYLNCTYAIKASLLIFYHESFPRGAGGGGDDSGVLYGFRDWRWLRRCLWAVDFLCASGWIVQFAATMGRCKTLESNWDPDPDRYCTWMGVVWFTPLIYVWHVVTDFLVYLLPFFLLRTLHIPRNVKYGLGFTFICGFLSIACGTTLLIFYEVGTSESINFWLYVLEQAFAVITGCLPALRAIVEAKSCPTLVEEGNTQLTTTMALNEARKHSNWMKDVMIEETVKRSEMNSIMTSLQESRALERAKSSAGTPQSGSVSDGTRAGTMTPMSTMRKSI